MFKKLYKKILRFFHWLLNLYLIPSLYADYRNKLRNLSPETQIFFLTRMDFGTFIYLLHYTRCWEESGRGKTCIVILSARYREIQALAQDLSPQSILLHPDRFLVRLALKVFGNYAVLEKTFYRVYALLFTENPHALRLFDPTLRSAYIASFDARRKQIPLHLSGSFLKAYDTIRPILNYCESTLLDAFQIHEQRGLSRRTFQQTALDALKKTLRIENPYVVININCKRYKEKGTTRKTINHPERYNCLIDTLIELGFDVVLQGREEQPNLKIRKGLIDYAKSGHTSVAHDLALFSGGHFAIMNKTGPESFSTVCNIPQLGLNYSELTMMIPNVKLRFFPKHAKHRTEDRVLSWKETLSSPSFFDIGYHNFDPEIEFQDLSEEELLAALEEFLPLVTQSDEKWLEYTVEQQEFKKHVHPLHLDLYDIKGVPCDVYLRGCT